RSAPPTGTPGRIEFNRQVRPILSQNCLKCHGQDSRERKAGLRLDIREEALAKLDGKLHVIAPGKPEESALVRRTASSDPDEQMPPPSSGKRLTAAEKETLRRWVEEGAEYQPHWAFLAPRRPPLPGVRDAAWCRNEIDRFI